MEYIHNCHTSTMLYVKRNIGRVPALVCRKPNRRTHRKDKIRFNEKEELMKVSDLSGKDVKKEREREK